MSGKGTGGISSVVVRRQMRWRDADAREVAAAWRRSGKPMWVFAREHGLVLQRLSRWAARLGGGSNRRVRFHPVRLVGGLRDRNSAIEVVLVDGCRVRVSEDFVAEELERVLWILEGRS